MVERLIGRFAATHLQPPLDDLLGFVLDAEYAFDQPAGFDTVSVATTDDPCSRLDVSVTLTRAMPSLGALQRTLMLVWSELAFSYLQASGVDHYQEATVFRFVTVIARHDFLVTGTVIVAGLCHAQLVRQDELAYGPFPRVPPVLMQRFRPL